ncbi:MAG: metal ABC transporter ATP-binding protein [Sarcina sp.]
MIKINNLYFSYNGQTPYNLENINITLPKENYISIVGENGSCKTTLLKLILGHLKPQKGTIDKTFKTIGYVPQRLENFNSQFSITVYEILKSHLKALKIKDLSFIDDVLNLVSMTEFKNRLIGSLSGGQQQRIFIARALIGSPDLLVLDELSTGIDERTQNEIYELIHSLTKNKKITVLSVEHSKEKAIKYSSLILELKYSKATLFTKQDYFNYYNKNLKNGGI